jgi:hypothetical protein
MRFNMLTALFLPQIIVSLFPSNFGACFTHTDVVNDQQASDRLLELIMHQLAALRA